MMLPTPVSQSIHHPFRWNLELINARVALHQNWLCELSPKRILIPILGKRSFSWAHLLGGGPPVKHGSAFSVGAFSATDLEADSYLREHVPQLFPFAGSPEDALADMRPDLLVLAVDSEEELGPLVRRIHPYLSSGTRVLIEVPLLAESAVEALPAALPQEAWGALLFAALIGGGLASRTGLTDTMLESGWIADYEGVTTVVGCLRLNTLPPPVVGHCISSGRAAVQYAKHWKAQNARDKSHLHPLYGAGTTVWPMLPRVLSGSMAAVLEMDPALESELENDYPYDFAEGLAVEPTPRERPWITWNSETCRAPEFQYLRRYYPDVNATMWPSGSVDRSKWSLYPVARRPRG